jgi:hypothetical protein
MNLKNNPEMSYDKYDYCHMSWGIIELELNVLKNGVKSFNKHNDSFPSWKIIDISFLDD